MFRHVALFRFTAEATDEQKQQAVDGLRGLPAQIPELQDYRVGPDLGVLDTSWDFAVVADVADIEAWRRYVEHPAHQQVIAESIAPIIAERSAVQYEI